MKTILPKFSILVVSLILFLFKPATASLFQYSDRIDSIQLVYDSTQLRLPGERFKIGIIAYYKNGKVRSTINLKGGTIPWFRFNVEVTGGSFNAGYVTVDSRLIPSKGKYILVNAYPMKGQWMKKELLLPLNYEEKLEIIPSNEMVKAPGFTFPFLVKVTFDNAKEKIYSRKNTWNITRDFSFNANGGSIRRQNFSIESDIEKINNHTVHMSVQSKRNSECADTLDVLLDYKANYRFVESGSSGSWAWSGSNGSNGSTGYSGADGEHGKDGEPGMNGPDIGVWADLYFDSTLQTNLLYIYAENLWNGRSKKYLVNPESGIFKAESNGGDGGHGGSGGNGGNGGAGEDGQWHERKEIIDSVEVTIKWQDPGQKGGHGGNGGYGGWGGSGGFGGNIYFYLTEDAWPYRTILVGDSNGGDGGWPGSGGSGGSGGRGGSGSTSGTNGSSGSSGSSGAWGSSGYGGNVSYETTDEFFEYVPVAQK